MCSLTHALRVRGDTGWKTLPASSHDHAVCQLKTTATPCIHLTTLPECSIILALVTMIPSPVQRDLDKPKTLIVSVIHGVEERVVNCSLCVLRFPRERTVMVVLPLALNVAWIVCSPEKDWLEKNG